MRKKSKRRGAKSKTNEGGDAAAREAMSLTVPIGPAAGTEPDHSAIGPGGTTEDVTYSNESANSHTPKNDKFNMREHLNQMMIVYEHFRVHDPENPLHEYRFQCFSDYAAKIMLASNAIRLLQTHRVQEELAEELVYVDMLYVDMWNDVHASIDKDKEFLVRIADGEDSSHSIYIAQAHYVLGSLYLQTEQNFDKAYWHWTSSLEICDKFLAAKSRKHDRPLPPNFVKLLFRDLTSRHPRTLLEYMKFVRQGAEIQVQDGRSCCAGIARTIPGDSCDYCKESRAENEKLSIFACARCHRFYYCSRKCQASHWKLSHKQDCRKDGEFRAGDFVCVEKTSKESVAEAHAALVYKLRDSRWLVSNGKWELLHEKELRVLPAMHRLAFEGTKEGHLQQAAVQTIKASEKDLLSQFNQQRLLLETNPDITMAELAKVMIDDLVQKCDFPPDVAEAVVKDGCSEMSCS